MDNSFTPLERILKLCLERHENFAYQEILLTRMIMHMLEKLLEKRNKILMLDDINEKLFMALIIIECDDALQPSELSEALGVTRTSVTRIIDDLEKRSWIERYQGLTDRRNIHLCLTEKGRSFLRELLPRQYHELKKFWSILSDGEKEKYEKITRKLITQLDKE